MSAVMPNEVFAPSDLEALQGYPQHPSNNKFAADPIKSNPSTPIPTTTSVTDSSEEFTLAEDCTQPLINVSPVPCTSNVSEQSTDRTEESISDENSSPEVWRSAYSGQSEGFLACLRKWARNIRNSKLMLVVLFLLLAMPISAGYMGARYMDSCPMDRSLPIIAFILGLIGFMLIVCRMVTLGVRRFECLDPTRDEQKTLTVTGSFLIGCLSFTEMVIVFSSTPVFNNPVSRHFCDKIFYYYIYYMNFALIAIAIIATLLHIPGNCSSFEDTEVQLTVVIVIMVTNLWPELSSHGGCGSLVVKVSDHGRHAMSSSPVPLKTLCVGERCTLNLSRAQTSSRWCDVVVRRGDASSGVVLIT
ncbi:uncharacterized protein TNCV_1849181 [Trichonephila clavipes]|nr:uncharacterized protein TNCV_1849181 [Trichonephila clavipes]